MLAFAVSAQSHLADDGVLVCEVGGLRAAVEAAYPHLPFEWLSTSQSEDMVFLLRKADFEADVRRVTASNQSSSDSSDGSNINIAPAEMVADAMAARDAESSPFADALSAIARGGRQTDPAMERAVAAMQTEDRKTAAAAAKKAAHKAAAAAGRTL